MYIIFEPFTDNNKKMMYFPLMLNINKRRCLVVGGGRIAHRKVRTLLEYGARPLVVAPEVITYIESLAHQRHITLRKRRVRKSDLKNAALVFAATNDNVLNATISRWCEQMDIPVNVVDDPELCTFIMPAILRRGELQVSVSTGGNFPALAKTMRNNLSGVIEHDFGTFLDIVSRARETVRGSLSLNESRKRQKLAWLCSPDVYEYFKNHGAAQFKTMIRERLKQS